MSLRRCSCLRRSSCGVFFPFFDLSLPLSRAVRSCFGGSGKRTSTSSKTMVLNVSPPTNSYPPATFASTILSSLGVPIIIVAPARSAGVGISTPRTANRTADSASSESTERRARASRISCTASSLVGATQRTVLSSVIALVNAGRRYARVLPDPVGAMISKFSSSKALVAEADCIGVGVEKPRLFSGADKAGKRFGSVASSKATSLSLMNKAYSAFFRAMLMA
mmetsp:Transcript_14701/g.22970  ORF Transcript_14701/g.22970 Transcript_14701/m.22970 type:complete len:223 (-) Transcript_14701:145-813(-)